MAGLNIDHLCIINKPTVPEYTVFNSLPKLSFEFISTPHIETFSQALMFLFLDRMQHRDIGPKLD